MPLSFFSRKSKQVTAAAEPAPASPPVAYDPGLVAALTQEHRHLVLLLDRAKGCVQGKRFDDVKGMLDQIRDGLAAHVQRETAQLHPYLTAQIKNDDRIAM